MSGYRWVITPSWLSGSRRSFLYSSCVYSCHLFLISSASVRSIPFLSFIVPSSSDSKASAYNAGYLAGFDPGLGRSPGEGNGNPLQYSCLENPWTKEPAGLQSMGLQRVRYNWVTSLLHEMFCLLYESPNHLSAFYHLLSLLCNPACLTHLS